MIRPAETLLALGGSGKKMSREVATNAHMSDGAAMALSKGDSLPRKGTHRNARRRRREKARRETQNIKRQKGTDLFASTIWRNGPPKGGNGREEHPRKYGKFFVTKGRTFATNMRRVVLLHVQTLVQMVVLPAARFAGAFMTT